MASASGSGSSGSASSAVLERVRGVGAGDVEHRRRRVGGDHAVAGVGEVLGEQAAPAADLHHQPAALPDRRQVGEDPGRASVGVEAEALVVDLGEGGSVVGVVARRHGRPSAIGRPTTKASRTTVGSNCSPSSVVRLHAEAVGHRREEASAAAANTTSPISLSGTTPPGGARRHAAGRWTRHARSPVLEWLMAPASRAHYEIHERLVSRRSAAPQRHTLAVTVPGHDVIEMPVSPLHHRSPTAASRTSTSTSTARPPTASSSVVPRPSWPAPEAVKLTDWSRGHPPRLSSSASPAQPRGRTVPGGTMSIAITEDHRALADTAVGLPGQARRPRRRPGAARGRRRGAARRSGTTSPSLGWLGLHVPEEHGGSGYGLEELVVVVEELGRAVAPGPFVPTVIASAVLAAAGDDATKATLPARPRRRLDRRRRRPRRRRSTVADGTASGDGRRGARRRARRRAARRRRRRRRGRRGRATASRSTTPPNLDPTRRSARVTLDGAPCDGARPAPARRSSTCARADPRRPRRRRRPRVHRAWPPPTPRSAMQFGRPIAMFQAVKHHCANMVVATELATAAVWDAARAAADRRRPALATPPPSPPPSPRPAADLCANLNTQVHGGIGFTWEHDAHLYLRRATALLALLDADARRRRPHRPHPRAASTRAKDRRAAARGRADPRRGAGVRRARSRTSTPTSSATELIETGYVMPHWPKPWGRDAGADRAARHRAGVRRRRRQAARLRHHRLGHPHAHPARHRGPGRPLGAPGARPGGRSGASCSASPTPAPTPPASRPRPPGSTAAGWSTARRCGPSGAHVRRHGLRHRAHQPRRAQARRHHDDGRSTCTPRASRSGRCKMTTGDSEFNEVFFNDVFVPDDDVVGPVDGGWTVARATLGNESVSIGGGAAAACRCPGDALIAAVRRPPRAPAPAAPARIGRYIADAPGDGPAQPAQRQPRRRRRRARPRGRHDQARAVRARPRGGRHPRPSSTAPTRAFMDGAGGMSNMLVLMHRGMSIAGGTSRSSATRSASASSACPATR